MDLQKAINIYQSCNGQGCNKCPLNKTIIWTNGDSMYDICGVLMEIEKFK